MSEVVEDMFAVGDQPRLDVSNEVGNVAVVSGSDDAISIVATVEEPERTSYDVRQKGGTVTVKARSKKGHGIQTLASGRPKRVDISVKVPSRIDVKLETVVGDVSLRDIRGSGTLSTVNGKLLMEKVDGDFGGSLTNGRLVMADATGSFNASTVNGGISFSGKMRPGSKSRFETVNGEVRVRLSGDTRVNVKASTVNGDFSSSSQVLAADASDTPDAEAELSVKIVNGSVKVE